MYGLIVFQNGGSRQESFGGELGKPLPGGATLYDGKLLNLGSK